jgi:hypothetical protein
MNDWTSTLLVSLSRFLKQCCREATKLTAIQHRASESELIVLRDEQTKIWKAKHRNERDQ